MTAISDRYDRLAAGFLARIAATPGDRWDAPSPAAGWTACDVVAHVVNGHRGILAAVRGTRPGPAHGVAVGPMSGAPEVAPGADLAAAFEAARADLHAALTDPATSAAVLPTPLGRVAFEHAADVVGALELLVHSWDLARAVGGDETLDAEAVEHTYRALAGHRDALAATGAFGAPVPAPEGADLQTRLLCLTGRRP